MTPFGHGALAFYRGRFFPVGGSHSPRRRTLVAMTARCQASAGVKPLPYGSRAGREQLRQMFQI